MPDCANWQTRWDESDRWSGSDNPRCASLRAALASYREGTISCLPHKRSRYRSTPPSRMRSKPFSARKPYVFFPGWRTHSNPAGANYSLTDVHASRKSTPEPCREVKGLLSLVIVNPVHSKPVVKQIGRPILLIRSEEHTSELQSLRHLVCR